VSVFVNLNHDYTVLRTVYVVLEINPERNALIVQSPPLKKSVVSLKKSVVRQKKSVVAPKKSQEKQ